MRPVLGILALACLTLAACRMVTTPEIDTSAAARKVIEDNPPEPEIPRLVSHRAFVVRDELVFFAIMDDTYGGSGSTWLLWLELDTDSNPETGFERTIFQPWVSPDDPFCIFSSDFPFPTCSGITYRQVGRVIQMRVPLSLLGGDDGQLNYTARVRPNGQSVNDRFYEGSSVVHGPGSEFVAASE